MKNGSNKQMLDPGRMTDTTVYGPPDSYYFLINGRLEGLSHPVQLLSRGRGREKGATRIPLRLAGEATGALELVGKKKGENSFWCILDWVFARNGAGLLQCLEVLLMEMPRPGNKLSGLELDAPGGTAELGESAPQTADREFAEEAEGLSIVATMSPFPEWLQFSSGAYDEVQHISFALVTGQPSALSEGAQRWEVIPLDRFAEWVERKNSPEHCAIEQFVPVDGKVVLAVLWLIERIRNRYTIEMTDRVDEDLLAAERLEGRS